MMLTGMMPARTCVRLDEARWSEVGLCSGQNGVVGFPTAHQGKASETLSDGGVCERQAVHLQLLFSLRAM